MVSMRLAILPANRYPSCPFSFSLCLPLPAIVIQSLRSNYELKKSPRRICRPTNFEIKAESTLAMKNIFTSTFSLGVAARLN
jgi:hypothetical protein